MQFTTDFPGGNGKCLSAQERSWGWEIEFLAESKAREPMPLWFDLRLSKLTGEKVRLRLVNSEQCLGNAKEWSRNQPVVRFSGEPWQRLAPAESTWTDGHVLETWFDIPLRGEELEFAFCYPYPTAQLLQTAKECPAFRKEIIGYSSQGRPIYRFSSDMGAPDRPGVYVLGRQHCGEVSGAWVIDGMMRYLSGPEGEWARRAITWWFVPIADPDGVEQGFYGKDQCYHDLNRAWHPSFPARAELVSISHDLRFFHKEKGGCLLFDMHGPGHEERDSYFVVHADTSDEERILLRSICGAANACLVARSMQAIDFHEKPKGTNTSAQSGMTSAQYAHALGMQGCTIEWSYQGERCGRAYEREDYARLGMCLVQGIVEKLCEERATGD